MPMYGSHIYTRPAPVPKMPPGIEELIEGMTKEVLRNNPSNIYEFCANHMLKLLEIRNGSAVKHSFTLHEKICRAQYKVQQRAKQRRQILQSNSSRLNTTFNVRPYEIDSTGVERFEPKKQNEDYANSDVGTVSKGVGNNKIELHDFQLLQDSRINLHNQIEFVENNISTDHLPKNDSGVNDELLNINEKDFHNTNSSEFMKKETNTLNDELLTHNSMTSNSKGETELMQQSYTIDEKEILQKTVLVSNRQEVDEIDNIELDGLPEKDKSLLNINESLKSNDIKDNDVINENNNHNKKSVHMEDIKRLVQMDNIPLQNTNIFSKTFDPENIHNQDAIYNPYVDNNGQTHQNSNFIDMSKSINTETISETTVIPNVSLNKVTDDDLNTISDDQKKFNNIDSTMHETGDTSEEELIKNNENIEATESCHDLKKYDNLEDKHDSLNMNLEGAAIKIQKVPLQNTNVFSKTFDQENIHNQDAIYNPYVDNNGQTHQHSNFIDMSKSINTETISETTVIPNVSLNKVTDDDLNTISDDQKKFNNIDSTMHETGDTSEEELIKNNENIEATESCHDFKKYDNLEDKHDSLNMNLESAAITIQKVFRNFLFKSRSATFDDEANGHNNNLDETSDIQDINEFSSMPSNVTKERRPLGTMRMDTVLQTVNEEKSLSLSTDDSSTLSSAATIIQAHVRGYLVRNKLGSLKNSTTTLVNSHGTVTTSLESNEELQKIKTPLNIHIVPEPEHLLSRDESIITSIDLSLDGSPPTSINLHPLGYDKSERRKQLKREDAVQSLSPPSNNSGKLSEDVESIKEVFVNDIISESVVLKDKETYDNGDIDFDTNMVEIDVGEGTYELDSENNENDSNSSQQNTVIRNEDKLNSLTSSSDEMDVVTPFSTTPASTPTLSHTGEFHDVVLPTKVSRGDTSVVREFKNVLVYILLWNSS